MNARDTATLAAWFREAGGKLAVGGSGFWYMAADVDAFLSAVAADLDAGNAPDPERVRGARFRSGSRRRGYPQREVDELLGALARRLDEMAGNEVRADSRADGLIERIKTVEFRTVRIRPDGYDEQEVDDFLDAAIATLRRGGRVSPPMGFTIVRLRPGYRKDDVDAFVNEICSDR
jgi:DivIVA domain-containing protein